jgi:hypothetical protein
MALSARTRFGPASSASRDRAELLRQVVALMAAELAKIPEASWDAIRRGVEDAWDGHLPRHEATIIKTNASIHPFGPPGGN